MMKELSVSIKVRMLKLYLMIILASAPFAFSDELLASKMEYKKWEQMDLDLVQNFFNQINQMDSIGHKYWNSKLNSEEELGYGYTIKHGSITAGTITLSIDFVYKDSEFLTGKFTIRNPNSLDSTPKLKAELEGKFLLKNDMEYLYYLNRRESYTPLKTFTKSLPVSMRPLLEPYGSLVYGYKGGFANSVIANRKAFYELTENATNIEFEQLLYSLNPVTRLMASEYFVNNPDFQTSGIKAQIKRNIQSVEKLNTLNGCIMSVEQTDSLFEKYSKMNLRKIMRKN